MLVEFSFSNIVYKQTDGIFMGNSLDSSMTNIFVGLAKQWFVLGDPTAMI